MFGFINALLRDLLGKYGRMILDFFLANSFIICLIVVLYGVVLIIAQRNLENLGKRMKTLDDDDILSREDPAVILSAKHEEYWEQLRQGSRFPFISISSSLLLYRVTQQNMSKLLIQYFKAQRHRKKYESK